ncbi:long-chain-fatty-acid--CoA ligase [Maricaulis salignorans]|uniref:3-methylmercaptopropionyl-CoA ligase n=1 Tax=Maricaulis salignorans TaxID=144026 RepID=A0A1G9LSL1_9PROT|nr:long-chain-fatty-acid--CoA ligase [Maricaulis salignorans]SDL64465.1 long-chain acyl-CoA synthetase [Maricaulis salignorans]
MTADSHHTIDHIVAHNVATTPDAPAITFEDRTLSYRELDARTSALADSLTQLGARKGDLIAFIGRNRPEHFEVIIAASKAGLIAVGLNWRLSERELAEQLADCGPFAVFTTTAARPTLDAACTGLSAEAKIITFGETGPLGHEGLVAHGNAESVPSRSSPEDLCMIWYTSGTTGRAKGVTFTHQSLWSIFPGAGAEWRVSRDSTSLVCMPTFHTAGVGWGLITLSFGGRIVIVDEFIPSELVDLMMRLRVTNSVFAPIMLEQIVSELEGRGLPPLPDLRAILYGASSITEPVLARVVEALDCELIQGYGLTEVNGTISILRSEEHTLTGERRKYLRSAGVAVPWGELKVVDPETGTELPSGEVGEIWGKSPGMMTGYWNKPEESLEALTPDGWLRTGDAGYIDSEGFLFLTDRVKDMIITGGENVYPIEIEHLIAAHPAVSEVAIVGVPDKKWGETIKAVVALKPGAHVTEQELIALTRAELASYKCPTSVDFVDSLPRNASGKILKRVIRDAYWTGHDRRIG